MPKTKLDDIVSRDGDKSGSRSRSAKFAFVCVAWAAALVVILIGLLDIVGTWLNITLLTSVTPQWIRMKVIAAVCFVLAGIELVLLLQRPSDVRRRPALQLPAILVGLAGFLTIWLYAIRMITGQKPAIGNVPFLHLFWDAETRIALLTAIIFLLVSCGLIAMARGSRRGANIAHGFILPAAIAGYMVQVSYILGVQDIHNLFDVPVALNTGVAFCLLCAGIFCSRTDTWLMNVFAALSAGGSVARRLLPAILLSPVLFACVFEYSENLGVFGPEALPGLVAILSTVLLVWVVWLAARFINPKNVDTCLDGDYGNPREMSAGSRDESRLVRYVYALLAAPLAIGLRFALMPLLGPGVQYITIYAVTAAVAVLGGLGPAVVAGLLGAILTDYILIEPLYVLDINLPFISRTAVVVLTSAFVGYVGDMLRAARARAERQAEELEQRVQERTRELSAEIAEHEQASRYARSLLEASLDPLVTISIDGKITDVNEATIQVTGVPRAELISTDFSNYFTEPQKAREGYRQVFATGFVTEYPLTIRHRSGRLTDVLYNATVYKDTHDKIAGVFAAARDITDKKIAEAELDKHRMHLEELVRQRTDDLTRSNRDLEQFAYVASHDLQEPLRAVAGFVEILRRRLGSSLDSKAAGYMDFVVDGAKRMQSLINGLLEYSRAGQAENNELTSAQTALDTALAYLRKTIEDSGAVVKSDELPAIHFDSTQLTQLFHNLIGNAIKFRGNANPRIHVRAKRERGGWQFAVSDNGIGFEPEYAERIFLIFQRLHSREQYPGTGIGLAICKKIVERHKGKIWVESKPGDGSTFYFTIPDA
jgi:PAS domain S-box-containing protein